MEHSKKNAATLRYVGVASVAIAFVLGSSPFAHSERTRNQLSESPRPSVSASDFEYLWYEAENMRGITQTAQHEPQLNPSYLEIPAVKAPGWSISGPGVSAEWSQGGESEWNSVAASADEVHGTIYQDLEIPRAGEYRFWVRYADWANKSESFVIRVTQQGREVF